MIFQDDSTVSNRPSVACRLALGFFTIVMLAAAGAYAIQYRDGLVRTHLANGHTWGLYVSGLAFFVGNAAGGLVLSASIYMFGLKSLKPFAKLGALTAFVNVVAAMLSILPDIGQPLRLWHLVAHPQFMSPLIWDIIVLNVYAILSLGYLSILILPGLSGKWRQKFTTALGNPEEFSEKWAKRLAPAALLFAASIHIVTAWIFSTQGSREWWHTAALAPDFLSVAVMAGTTVVLLASALIFGVSDRHQDAYRTMTRIIVSAFIVHLFLMYNDMFIKYWYHAEGSMHAINYLFTRHLSAHAFEVLAPLAAVLLLVGKSVWVSRSRLSLTCALLLSGVLVHRYLIMPPAFNVQPLTFTPIGAMNEAWSYPVASGRWADGINTFSTTWNYVPSSIEWVIFAGVCAFACFAIGLGSLVLPIGRAESRG